MSFDPMDSFTPTILIDPAIVGLGSSDPVPRTPGLRTPIHPCPTLIRVAPLERTLKGERQQCLTRKLVILAGTAAATKAGFRRSFAQGRCDECARKASQVVASSLTRQPPAKQTGAMSNSKVLVLPPMPAAMQLEPDYQEEHPKKGGEAQRAFARRSSARVRTSAASCSVGTETRTETHPYTPQRSRWSIVRAPMVLSAIAPVRSATTTDMERAPHVRG